MLANAADARPRVRTAVLGARAGGKHVPGRQYSRLLEATFALVAGESYRELTVAKVATRARLADRGLIRNTARATAGFRKAWQLTPTGETLLHSSRAPDRRAA